MRTKRNDKIYTYPLRTLAIDDDVFAAVKAIAKTKRMPLYRLVSDICRKWLVKHEKQRRAGIEEIAAQAGVTIEVVNREIAAQNIMPPPYDDYAARNAVAWLQGRQEVR